MSGTSSYIGVDAPNSLMPESIVVGHHTGQALLPPLPVQVLHLINGEHFSGAERVQQNLGKHLEKFGFQAQFACLKPGKFLEYCGLPRDRVRELPMRSRLDIAVVRSLIAQVKEQNIELLHAHTPRTALVATLVSQRTGVPWVYHIHSPTARDSTRGLINRVNDVVERLAISSCNLMITVSRSLRREMLARGVKKDRLVAIPNGVGAIEPIDPQERLTQDEWRLGMVALMRPRKGVEVALDAMARLKQAGKRVKLELIGGFESTDYQEQILSLIAESGVEDIVEWTGFTSDVASAIRRLDALVLPSLFGEGMPMVVLEALSAGVPVVATRVEGTPEVVRHGIEGLLADPRNAQDLAAKIHELTSDRHVWLSMCRSAVARHRSRYSDVEMARRVARAYRRVISKQNSALNPEKIFGISEIV